MSNEFLPDGYELPEKSNGFTITKDKQTVRILGNSATNTFLTGWIDWKPGEKKQKVFTLKEQPKLWKDDPRHTWVLPVYNYGKWQVEMWEITQKTVLSKINELIKWKRGNPNDYDLEVWKKGESMQTEYFVETLPDGKQPISKAIEEKYSQYTVDFTEYLKSGNLSSVLTKTDTDEDMPRGKDQEEDPTI